MVNVAKVGLDNGGVEFANEVISEVLDVEELLLRLFSGVVAVVRHGLGDILHALKFAVGVILIY